MDTFHLRPVVDADSKALLALIGTAEPATVELKKLYVAATVRGLGLGRRLIELVEAEAGERGAHRICLWTDTRFKTAHSVDEHLGYARLSQTRELHDLSASVEYQYQKGLSMRKNESW